MLPVSPYIEEPSQEPFEGYSASARLAREQNPKVLLRVRTCTCDIPFKEENSPQYLLFPWLCNMVFHSVAPATLGRRMGAHCEVKSELSINLKAPGEGGEAELSSTVF